MTAFTGLPAILQRVKAWVNKTLKTSQCFVPVDELPGVVELPDDVPDVRADVRAPKPAGSALCSVLEKNIHLVVTNPGYWWLLVCDTCASLSAASLLFSLTFASPSATSFTAMFSACSGSLEPTRTDPYSLPEETV